MRKKKKRKGNEEEEEEEGRGVVEYRDRNEDRENIQKGKSKWTKTVEGTSRCRSNPKQGVTVTWK